MTFPREGWPFAVYNMPAAVDLLYDLGPSVGDCYNCYTYSMAELKTKKNSGSVAMFIKTVEDEERRKDAKVLLKIFADATKERPALWGTSIIGYGSYHYKSDRSAQEGDWMLTGFSPRKQNISIYIMPGFKEYGDLLKKLGKHKVSGGSCLYIKRLSDIDTSVLKKLIATSVRDMKKRHQTK